MRRLKSRGSYARVASCTVVLSGCITIEKPGDPVYLTQPKVEVARAMLDGLRFEDAEVLRLAIAPPQDDPDVTVHGQQERLRLDPGDSKIMSLSVEAPVDDPVEATLLQFDGIGDEHIRVPSTPDDDGQIELDLTVSGDICESLCDIEHTLAVFQAVELASKETSRRLRLDITLDCRELGKRDRCTEVSEAPEPAPVEIPFGAEQPAGAGGDGAGAQGASDPSEEPVAPSAGDASQTQPERVDGAAPQEPNTGVQPGNAGMAVDPVIDPVTATAGAGAATTAGTGAAGTGGSGPSDDDAGVDGSPDPVSYDCINVTDPPVGSCPDALPPSSGSCAPAGACCQRSSNLLKEAALAASDAVELEYRLRYSEVINHPSSLGHPTVLGTAQTRATTCSGEQCTLMRFTLPREGGAYAAGAGQSQIGPGHYNCDGSYSFYSEVAAPNRALGGRTDPARWGAPILPATVNPAASGVDLMTVAFADNSNREVTCMPVPNTLVPGAFYEVCTQGFELLDIDTSEAGKDCMGAWDGRAFSYGGRYETYAPLAENEVEPIPELSSQTYCGLLAFGLSALGSTCSGTARCTPGDGGCTWLKLPDSLCPVGAGEKALFGCHLGAEGNPNAEAGYPASLACSADAPITARDESAPDEGQCCDPLGQSATLPACNAYRLVLDFAATAVEIADSYAVSAPTATCP